MAEWFWWGAVTLNLIACAISSWTSWRLHRTRERHRAAISIGEPIRAAIEDAARRGQSGPFQLLIMVARDGARTVERVH